MRVSVCQSNNGELGTERSTSTRSRLMQEAISGIIAPTLPNSGSSTLCTEVSRASSSRDGWETSLCASGSVSPGYPSPSTSLCLASANANTTITRMTTSTSLTEQPDTCLKWCSSNFPLLNQLQANWLDKMAVMVWFCSASRGHLATGGVQTHPLQSWSLSRTNQWQSWQDWKLTSWEGKYKQKTELLYLKQ